MHALCEALATGTRHQQKHAWERLTAENFLWRACQEAVRDFGQLPLLLQDYAHLSQPSALEGVKRLYPDDEAEAERMVAHARRVVASAVAATLALHAPSVENLEAELLRWVFRAMTLEEGAPPSVRFVSNFVSDDAVALVKRCFAVLAPYRAEGWQMGFARTAILMLLGAHQPQRRLANVPVLLVQNGQGRVGYLAMELLADGFGEVFASPAMFIAFGTRWRQAMEQVRQRVPLPEGTDGLWELVGDVAQVDGASAQATFQVVLSLLGSHRLYDTGCAISATVDSEGKLGRVEGIVGEHGTAGPKLLAAKQARLSRVVISPEDFRVLSPQAREALQSEPFPLQVLSADTLEKAMALASGVATGLLEYFEQVIALPDREETLPAYMGGRKRSALYVKPEVLKWEREAKTDLLSAEAVPNLYEEVMPSSDLHEEVILYGERYTSERAGRRTGAEERVAWAEERRRLVRGEVRRVVILAPPGQGKSLLAEREAGRVASAANQRLQTKQTSVDELPLPIVVRLDDLARFGIQLGEPPEQALRRALASALREQGCPEAVCAYLAEHAHEERVWLFLDALDEVDPEAHETLKQFFGVMAKWQCRLMIGSRPYGYEEWNLPFDRVEYRLAPFSDRQVREFVGKWFGSASPNPMEALLAHSPAVQQVSRSPFLLTLLCAVSEQEAIPHDITRTELYDRALRLCLGGERRAVAWLPLLRELAWRMVLHDARRPHLMAEQVLELFQTSENRPPVLGGALHLSSMEKANLLLDELCQKRLLSPVRAYRAYVFPHRSVAEFLAGWYLAEQVNKSGEGWSGASLCLPDSPEAVRVSDWLDKKAWLPEWQEVVIFCAGKLRDPLPLLELLADEAKDDYFRHRLTLGALCLPEVKGKGSGERFDDVVRRIVEETVGLWIHWYGTRWNRTIVTYKSYSINQGHLSGNPHLDRCLSVLAGTYGEAILPAVEQALESPNEEIRKSALSAVRRIGSVAATEPILARLTQLLQDPNDEVREAAAEAVGGIGSRAATEPILTQLAHLFQDPNDEVRRAAARAVIGIGSRVATEPIFVQFVQLLRDPNDRVRDAVVWFMIERFLMECDMQVVTEPILTQLAHLLQDPDDKVRIATAYVLWCLRSRAATEPILTQLAHLLQDPNDEVRRAAADAVGQIGSEAATEPILTHLAQLLQDPNDEVRQAAAEAVRFLGSAAATEPILRHLTHLLQDPDRWIRQNAAMAVISLSSTQTQEANLRISLAQLTQILQYANDDGCQPAAEAVGQIGSELTTKPITTYLARLLQDPNDKVRYVALWVVVYFKLAYLEAATEPILVQIAHLLQDPNDEVRQTAAEAVRFLGSEAATEPILTHLAQLLQDPNDEVRRAAADAVGQIGSAAATEPILTHLAQLLQDPNDGVRLAATRAVQSLGGATVTEPILAQIAHLLQDPDNEVCLAAVKIVGQIGRAAATEPILVQIAHLLRDSDDKIRQAAAEVMENLVSIATEPILTQLAHLLQDPSDEVRQVALWAVSQIGSAAATEPILTHLAQLLQDPNDEVRQAAAEAVGQIGSAAATEPILTHLAQLLQDPNDEVRLLAAQALASVGRIEVAEPVLVQLLEDSNDERRRAALDVVEQLGSRAATESILAQLAQLLEDSNDEVFQATLWTVMEMGRSAATVPIVRRLISLLKPNKVSGVVASAVLKNLTAQGIRIFRDSDGELQIRTLEQLSQ